MRISFKLVILFLLFFPLTFSLAAGEKERELELKYPYLPGPSLPGIPEYAQFLFKLAVFLTGLILFGVLIYGGILYLTSAGRPGQIMEAKRRIFSALLGVGILLGSWLILTTIFGAPPKLTMPGFKPPFFPLGEGIYLCNYKVPDISSILGHYLSDDIEKQLKGKEELKKLFVKRNDKYCYQITSSGNLNFTIKKGGEYTFFALPAIIGDKREYRYGIIGHQLEGRHGQCKILAKGKEPAVLYHKDALPFQPDFGHLKEIRSVTLLRKPTKEPNGEGVTLYPCYKMIAHKSTCPDWEKLKMKTPEELFSYKITFKPSVDIRYVKKEELVSADKKIDYCKAGLARSLGFDPELGAFFVILFTKENFQGTCYHYSQNKPDLYISLAPAGIVCSMIVIKGH